MSAITAPPDGAPEPRSRWRRAEARGRRQRAAPSRARRHRSSGTGAGRRCRHGVAHRRAEGRDDRHQGRGPGGERRPADEEHDRGDPHEQTDREADRRSLSEPGHTEEGGEDRRRALRTAARPAGSVRVAIAISVNGTAEKAAPATAKARRSRRAIARSGDPRSGRAGRRRSRSGSRPPRQGRPLARRPEGTGRPRPRPRRGTGAGPEDPG
jgi:hypothetical protein